MQTDIKYSKIDYLWKPQKKLNLFQWIWIRLIRNPISNVIWKLKTEQQKDDYIDKISG